MLHNPPPAAEMYDSAVRAAQAGEHFLPGKPMAMTLAEAYDIIGAVVSSDICGKSALTGGCWHDSAA